MKNFEMLQKQWKNSKNWCDESNEIQANFINNACVIVIISELQFFVSASLFLNLWKQLVVRALLLLHPRQTHQYSSTVFTQDGQLERGTKAITINCRCHNRY